MYFRRFGFVLVAAGVTLVGCGDDDDSNAMQVNNATADAAVVDAALPPVSVPSDASVVVPRDGGLDAGRRDASVDAGGSKPDASIAKDSGSDAKVPDAGPTGSTGGALATCAPCEATSCQNIVQWADIGPDLTKFCSLAEGTALSGPGMGKPRTQLCTDLVDCAHRTGCGKQNLYGCFCGSLSLDECVAKTSTNVYAADGACAKEFAAAAEAMLGSQVFEQASDIRFASGHAYALLECDIKQCSDECYDLCKGQANGVECVEGSKMAYSAGYLCAADGKLERTSDPVPAGKVPGVDCAAPGICFSGKCTDSPYEE
jgi:hypothetical protein